MAITWNSQSNTGNTGNTGNAGGTGGIKWNTPDTPSVPVVAPQQSFASSLWNGLVGGVKAVAGYSNNVLNQTSQPLTQAMTDVNKEQDASVSGQENPLKAGYNQSLDIMKGTTGAIGGAINAGVIQPLGKIFGNIPGMQTVANSKYSIVSDTLDKLDQGSQALGHVWNQFAQNNPTAAKAVSDAGTIAQFMSLFVPDTPEAKQAVQTVADTVTNTAKSGADLVKQGASSAKDLITTSPEEQFGKNLSNAEKTIYPKLTPTEKANVQLRTETGLGGTKSVPDLINDPKTKPVIEAVANLPEDLQVKPNEPIAVTEDKLSQGASRLHQDTSNYLYERTKTKGAEFSDRAYSDYFSQKVLQPIIKEFGADSLEAKAMQDNIATGKGLIESNNAYEVYKARQEFQGVMKRDYPNAFKKQPGSLGALLDPRASARLEMARTYRTAMNDFISDELLAPNDPYKARLKEESNLLRAKDIYRAKSASDLGKSTAQRFVNRHPLIKSAVKAVRLGGVIKGAEVLPHL